MALKNRSAIEVDELKMELGHQGSCKGCAEGAGQRGDMGFEDSKQFYPLLGGGMGLVFEHLKFFSVFSHWPQEYSLHASRSEINAIPVRIAKGF